MARLFKMEIVTPVESFGERTVSFLDVPAMEGRLTVLAGHEPMICSLKPGRLLVRDEKGTGEEWEIEQGTMDVGKDKVTLLVSLRAS